MPVPRQKQHTDPTPTIGAALADSDQRLASLLQNLRQIQVNAGVGKFGKYYIANFMFLLVLVGIELDMAGLFMSARTYWEYDNSILRVLVFFFGASFISPLAIQTWVGMSTDVSDALDDRASGVMVAPRGGKEGASFMATLKSAVRTANPHGGRMELYHWVPGVRFYLIVKESYDLTDVDAIFKVNTLSSFTLGIYQLVGILTTAVAKKPFTVFIILNIVSQVLNWGITIAYFVTPVSKWMGNAANARTMSRHYQGIMNHVASLEQRLASSVGNEEQFENAKAEIDVMKKHVARMVMDQFFPIENEGKREAAQTLNHMRDQDFKEFVLLIRNQAMAAIDMPGGV